MGQLVAEVLETWRKSDRRAADLPGGIHEQVGARWAADELRALYHALTVEGMANAPGRAELQRIRTMANLAASD